jgi:hypothetical protein
MFQRAITIIVVDLIWVFLFWLAIAGEDPKTNRTGIRVMWSICIVLALAIDYMIVFYP